MCVLCVVDGMNGEGGKRVRTGKERRPSFLPPTRPRENDKGRNDDGAQDDIEKERC